MRSFHATVTDSSVDSCCETLGFTKKEVDVCACCPTYMPVFFAFSVFIVSMLILKIVCWGKIWQEIQNFYCKNCEYDQHQCFVCGKLGSSNKTLGAEV